MNIFIDNKSGAPIYEQIFTQLKSQIISGTLPSDEALPSIRSLAKDLRISVVTTKRAYDELEKEGFIYLADIPEALQCFFPLPFCLHIPTPVHPVIYQAAYGFFYASLLFYIADIFPDGFQME